MNDEMRHEIKEYLKESLEIRIEEHNSAYGDGSWVTLNLLIDGDIISSEDIDT
jgi:hypothetical protein